MGSGFPSWMYGCQAGKDRPEPWSECLLWKSGWKLGCSQVVGPKNLPDPSGYGYYRCGFCVELLGVPSEVSPLQGPPTLFFSSFSTLLPSTTG